MPYDIVKKGEKFVVQKKDGSRSFGEHDTKAEAEKQLEALYASEHRGAARCLYLRGATGVVRTEQWNGREHLVIPVTALQEAVIHAVNADEPEFVPIATLKATEGKWQGHPLVVKHPVRNGMQVSAHDDEILRQQGFGFIRTSSVSGTRLRMEALVDPLRLEALGQQQLLADLRAGRPCEVSVGAYVRTRAASGKHNGRNYKTEWVEIVPDHLAFLPGGIGACSLEMGCGAHRAAQVHEVTEDDLEDKSPRSMNKFVELLKERVLALFDTPEQAAAEEAAELVAYTSMKTLITSAGDHVTEATGLIDTLIADETENPTATPQAEETEEEVEDARLEAIRMLCYSAISQLQAVVGACYTQQAPDLPEATSSRYMEAFTERFAALAGREISKKNAKTIQAAHDSAHDMHTHTVALGAACDGMKQLGGSPRAACSCQETDMQTKKDRIAALLANEHNTVKNLTEATSDEVLTVLEAQAELNKTHATELRAAQAKQTETDAALKTAQDALAAAQASQIPAAELADLRSLAAERKQKDAAEKVELVTKLEGLKTLTKEQLEAKSLEDLRTLALFAKIEAPKPSFAGRGVPQEQQKTEDFAPPDPYAEPVKALAAAIKK